MSDTPVGTLQWRITTAINLHHTTKKSQEEIADELGVSARKVRDYLNSEPAEDVEQFLAEQQAKARTVASSEYERSLKEVGEQARTAEEPVEVWTDANGDVQTIEVRDGQGNLLERKPVPQSHEMGPDTTERFFRREEMREILRDWRTMVGADAPEESRHEITGEDGAPLAVNISHHRVTDDESEETDE